MSSRVTPRELEILLLIRDGLSNKQIALRLGISERTVKNHVMMILLKLDAANRTEAVVKALRADLIDLGLKDLAQKEQVF